ncbi:MAG: hypothetical protein HYS09_03845 [Chloroflexi bacterium]|nr:hypothetical protein [Chloroflexota bacterium]
MPQFTITLSDRALARLQALVAAYNANSGQQLAVKDWILLHLKELAIGQDLALAADALEKQKQEELAAVIEAERRRLLDSL